MDRRTDVLDMLCWAVGASVVSLVAMMARVIYVAWRDRGRNHPGE